MKKYLVCTTYVRPYQEFSTEWDTLNGAVEHAQERANSKRCTGAYVLDDTDVIVADFEGKASWE